MASHHFTIRGASRDHTTGQICFGGRAFACTLGKTGITAQKREGDGASPAGAFRLLGGYFRADKLPRPKTLLPLRPLRPTDGWCDSPHDPSYNHPVNLPFPKNHEKLWRDDQLYDIIIVLDQNINPRQPGAGSAIFFHIAAKDFTPTQGCIAVTHDVMHHALRFARPGSQMLIGQK